MLDVIFLCGAAIVAVPVCVLTMRAVKFGWKRLDNFTRENFGFSVDAGALRVTRPFSLAAQSVAVRLISSAELWFPLVRIKLETDDPAERWTEPFVYYEIGACEPMLWERFVALLTLDVRRVSFFRRREARRQDILSRIELGEVDLVRVREHAGEGLEAVTQDLAAEIR
jgi:hypothetical protein